MGASVEVVRKTEEAEPTGDLRVRSSKLRGIRIKGEQVPELIDELPILMVAASTASGRTEILGAGELRVKETDRIRSMTLGLSALGAKITELEDGCVIEGVQELRGGRLKSFGDHRTAMALVVAALRTRDTVEIDDRECVKISYPNFFEDLKRVGSF
jgi:3-phosphoshikimate 1-carboxyvinyltransferase